MWRMPGEMHLILVHARRRAKGKVPAAGWPQGLSGERCKWVVGTLCCLRDLGPSRLVIACRARCSRCPPRAWRLTLVWLGVSKRALG